VTGETARLRLGLLSTARINTLLVGGARASGAADVVAVASRELSKAQAHADELGIPRAHGSYEALLEDPEVDAVYVSLPNSMHVDWSVRALEAGKHVLCEKPLTRRPEEAERAFDAAERVGRVLMEAFMWRHHPQASRLLELVPEVGPLRLVRAAFSFPPPAPDNVRLSAALDGGALMDVGCYCVSGTRLVTRAEPERCAGEQVIGGDGVDVAFAATMRFPGDVLAHFDCGMNMAARDELEVVGQDGSLFLDDPWHSRSPVIKLRRPDGSSERVEVEHADPYGCELEELAAVAIGDRPPRFGREDAVGQARAIAALYEAAA
jgi:D-xylose 1-dehydrogenase (NADP+, D-xylono-1,5-lactone-forming)